MRRGSSVNARGIKRDAEIRYFNSRWWFGRYIARLCFKAVKERRVLDMTRVRRELGNCSSISLQAFDEFWPRIERFTAQ
jgi:hypothetical protein